jgi:ATP-dependent DNA ligase
MLALDAGKLQRRQRVLIHPASSSNPGERWAEPGAVAIWQAVTLPTIPPVTLPTRCEPFDNPDWLFELKYDGFRAVLYVEPGSPRLVSRRGLTFARFQQLAQDVAGKLHATTAILDGEIICPDGDGRPNFHKMLSGKPAVCFVAFDAMWLDGEDLRALPLVERKKLLQRVLPKRSNLVAEALAIEGRGKDLFATRCRQTDLVAHTSR